MSTDLRDSIFISLEDREYTAELTVCSGGMVCGTEHARTLLEALGCAVLHIAPEGSHVAQHGVVLRFSGSAKAVAMAEDLVIGAVAKPSGIARAAARAAALARPGVRVVAGASKKMPREIKQQIRHAVLHGGAGGCISDAPFIYLDKNYVRMFGSVAETLRGISHMPGYVRVIQLRGLVESLEKETHDALDADAEILMVDTGRLDDLDIVARMATNAGKRARTIIAFAGEITLERIPEICTHDVDILDIGRAVIDAPLVDCRLDVTETRQRDTPRNGAGLELNLLSKTEILLDHVSLDHGVNLTALAATAAEVLQMPLDKLAVIDVRADQVAFDILLPSLRAEQFYGKEDALLAAVGAIPGVRVARGARVHSRGILGAISLDAESVPDILAASAHAAQGTGQTPYNKNASIVVFPTGFELMEQRIEDTNTPYLCKTLCDAGFLAEPGQSLPDSLQALAGALAAVAPHCRAVITTGGVGAEDKDFSVEAIQSLDPDLAAPYLVRFTRGEGRHVKDGIRIGVGLYQGCLLIALPGPHDEVCLAAPVLVRGLKQKCDKHSLAEHLAACLRKKFCSSALPHTPHACPHANAAHWKH